VKSLKISLSHGRIWAVETSSGARATSSTLVGALEQLLPANLAGAYGARFEDMTDRWVGIEVLMETIPDPGGDGRIGRGQASG
jgi:hypothetical protein